MNSEQPYVPENQPQLHETLTSLRNQISQCITAAQSAEDNYLALLLGTDWIKLLRTCDLRDLIFHQNPKYRRAGIYLCCYYDPSFPEGLMVSLLRAEEDSDIRAEILCALGARYSGSINPDIVKLLREVLLDESESQKCREAAYVALFDVVGRLQNLEHIILSPDWFPALVDWDFVNTLV